MQTVAMSWQHAGTTAAVLAAVGAAMAFSPRSAVRTAGAFLRETAVIGVLYGLWRLAGHLSVMGTEDAFRRARWIEHFDQRLPLPDERSVQQLILGHDLIVQAANLYYACMHFPMMFVFLIWLFTWHRDRYRPVRSVMALTTLGCLLIQFVPVAPPRMLPGFVDTGVAYGQSVYSHGLPIDQLSAMPSVHVAWAAIVGFYSWRIGISRWRYIGSAHLLITLFVVVATGNHWWLDGIVAVAVLIASAGVVYGVRTAWRALTDRARSSVDEAAVSRPVATLSLSGATSDRREQ